MPKSLEDIQKKLKHLANKKKAKIHQRFFKTGPGEYGEGDVFIGVTVPKLRKLAKEHKTANPSEIKKLSLMDMFHVIDADLAELKEAWQEPLRW